MKLWQFLRADVAYPRIIMWIFYWNSAVCIYFGLNTLLS